MKPHSLAVTLFLSAASLACAELPPPAQFSLESAISTSTAGDWEFTLSPYGWAAGLDGTLGVKGITAETNVPFTDILSALDMTAMMNIEVRKGRWGGWVDGLYLKMSVGGNPPGPLFGSIGLSVTEVIAEAAVYYRVLESERGFFDLYAGARYMSVGSDLSLNISDSGVGELSEQISEKVVDQVVSAVKSEAESALASARAKIASKVAAAEVERVSLTVEEKATNAQNALNQVRLIAAAHPKLAASLRNNSRFKAAVESVATARIDERLAETQQSEAIASTAVASVKAAALAAADQAKSRAQKAVAKAEKELADKIEDALRKSIPSEISGTAEWVDPFVGMRALYNVTDRIYLIAKADIGGFGVSSDLVWQAYGAVGCHLTKSGKTTAELGYKYMAVDYTSGGFTYDVSMSGLMMNIGFKF